MKYKEILSKTPQEFNNYMREIKDYRIAEELLIHLLSVSEKHKNKTRIDRVYSRMCMLRRNEELDMINDREWYE